MEKTYGDIVVKYLKKEGVRIVTERKDGLTTILYPVTTDKLPGLNMVVHVRDNGRVSVSSQLGSAYDEYLRRALYPVLNDANSQFAFVSFSIDNENDVIANMSFIINDLEPGAMVKKYLNVFSSVCDDVVPKILLKLWGRVMDVPEAGDDFDEPLPELEDEFTDEADHLSEEEILECLDEVFGDAFVGTAEDLDSDSDFDVDSDADGVA